MGSPDLPPADPDAAGIVAGADGCRAGWVVVEHHLETGTFARHVVSSDDLLSPESEAPGARADMLAIDMVIGLPPQAEPGGRDCDRAARKLLGPTRGRSVFSPPAAPALDAESYEEANRLQSESGPDAPGLSIQTYHLFPKLRAIRTHVTPARQRCIVEVHPELSFYAMNGDAPIEASKHTPEGRTARMQQLREAGIDDIEAAVGEVATGDVGADDVLDAHAACWSAGRIRRGEGERLPPSTEDAPRDGAGLRMEIWR